VKGKIKMFPQLPGQNCRQVVGNDHRSRVALRSPSRCCSFKMGGRGKKEKKIKGNTKEKTEKVRGDVSRILLQPR